jgi:hypothetical protein
VYYRGDPVYVTQSILDELNLKDGEKITTDKKLKQCLALGVTLFPQDLTQIEYPELTKQIVVFGRGWFKSIFFWSKKHTLEITAKQFELDPSVYGPIPIAGALIIISGDGKELLSYEVPFPMPPGRVTLLLQVYLISQMPNYEHPEWQNALNSFCYSFPEFKPPEKLYWGGNNYLDCL